MKIEAFSDACNMAAGHCDVSRNGKGPPTMAGAASTMMRPKFFAWLFYAKAHLHQGPAHRRH